MLFGVLNATRGPGAPAFTHDDLEYLTRFASQLSIAVANSMAFDAERRRSEQLELVNTLLREIAGTSPRAHPRHRGAADPLRPSAFPWSHRHPRLGCQTAASWPWPATPVAKAAPAAAARRGDRPGHPGEAHGARARRGARSRLRGSSPPSAAWWPYRSWPAKTGWPYWRGQRPRRAFDHGLGSRRDPGRRGRHHLRTRSCTGAGAHERRLVELDRMKSELSTRVPRLPAPWGVLGHAELLSGSPTSPRRRIDQARAINQSATHMGNCWTRRSRPRAWRPGISPSTSAWWTWRPSCARWWRASRARKPSLAPAGARRARAVWADRDAGEVLDNLVSNASSTRPRAAR